MKTPKEASKYREWEKVRRDKLSNSIITLSKLLPNYDPSQALTKIEILQKAIAYIQELQKKLKDVLTGEEGVKHTESEEIKTLYEYIKKLLSRNEQLTNLLKDTGIKVPNGYGNIKNFKRAFPWSNKIDPDKAKTFAEKEAQKENEKQTSKLCKKRKLTDKTKTNKKRKPNGKNKKQKPRNPAIINVQLSSIIPQSAILKPSQSCLVIANNASGNSSQICNKNNKIASTVVTNSSSLSIPKVASIITPPSTRIVSNVNSKLSSLGPGTLILANGNVVPILPQSTVLPTTAILSNPTPIILKPSNNNNTAFIVMQTKTSKEINVTKLPIATTTTLSTASSTTVSTSTSVNTFARIRPKVRVTRTTPANKVPIPALTSHYNALPSVAITKQLNVNKVNISGSKKKIVKKRKIIVKSTNQKRMKIADTASTAVTENVANDAEIETVLVEKPVQENKNSKEVSASDNTTTTNIDDSNKDTNEGKAVDSNQVKAMESNQVKAMESNQVKTMESNHVKASESNQIKAAESNQVKVVDSNEVKAVCTNEVKAVKEQIKTVANKLENGEIKEGKTNKENQDGERVNSKDNDCNIQEIENEVAADIINKEPDIITAPITTTTPVCTMSATIITTNSVTTSNAATPIKTSSITSQDIQEKSLEIGINLPHSELSNDIFSSLQVPIGGQNPESTSPTAAFLLAFPLVSSLTGVKVTEVIEEENSESRHGTPTLLQIGTMDTTKTTQSVNTESLTPNLLNLDNFSFFSSGKDNFYSSFENANNSIYPVLEQNTKNNCNKHEVVDIPKKVSQKEVNLITKSNIVQQNNYVSRQANTALYTSKTTASYTSESQPMINYDTRNKVSHTNPIVSTNRKSLDPMQSNVQYNIPTSNISLSQCNTYNPFSDFSKSGTVHSYSTFSKPYSDPLYTNSSHYNYSQNHSFDQNSYYSSKVPVKSNNSSYCATTTYSEIPYAADCKAKRHNTSNNNSTVINYYNHNQNNKNQQKEKFPPHSNLSKTSKPPNNTQPKPPINWMTTPDFRSQPSNAEYLVPPPFTKELEYNPNSFYSSNSSYFNSTSSVYPAPEFQNTIIDNRKTFDSSLPIISSTNTIQRTEFEDNQFSWSPTKLPQFLETPHSFVSSTLPTLVGDLALGTTPSTFNDQKVETREHNITKSKDNRRSKVHTVSNYDHNQSNFLSVSQLVENKTDLNNSGSNSRTTNRRNSGNRNTKTNSHKGTKHSHKVSENKELVDSSNQLEINAMEKKSNVNYSNSNNWLNECNNKPQRHSHKNPQSSYSAEALIGHHDQSDNTIPKQRCRQQQSNHSSVNKTIPLPSFLSDNIVPYFPPVELAQDNNFIQSNTNYQSTSLSHSFPTSVQNNPTYQPGTFISTGNATITSNYLQASGLISDFPTHDYSTTVADNSGIADKISDTKHCNRIDGIKQATNNSNSRTEDRPQQINTDCSVNSTNFMKKSSKHKNPNENNLPGIVDFGFLSMPNTINSPILPDDFHAHSNFLPPPTPSQLYSCKTPLYPKQTSDLNSGSLLSLPPVPVSRGSSQHFDSSTSNAGSSLTSFNLSAIFPEMNKGAVSLPTLYQESRNKNYNLQRNYLGSTVQVTFNNNSKSTPLNYINTVATTYSASN